MEKIKPIKLSTAKYFTFFFLSIIGIWVIFSITYNGFRLCFRADYRI